MPLKRPFTPNELNEMEQAGYDTSSYKGEAVEFPDPPQVTSSREALASHFLANLLPSIAGAGGFAAGANPALPWNAAAIAAAPETFGISLAVPVISGLVGGGVTSGATKKLQDTFTPKSIEDRLALSAQEHPTASTIGGVSSGLTVMRPSLPTVRDAASAIPQLLARGGAAGETIANRAGIQALKTIGAGAGISAASSIGEQAITQGSVDPKQVIEDALIGAATMHKPTALGHAVMRSSEPVRSILSDPDKLLATLGQVPNLNEHVKQYADYVKQQKAVTKALKLKTEEDKAIAEQEVLKKVISEPITNVKIPEKESSKIEVSPKEKVQEKTPPTPVTPSNEPRPVEQGKSVVSTPLETAALPIDSGQPALPPSESPAILPPVQPSEPVRPPINVVPPTVDTSKAIAKKVNKKEFFANKAIEHKVAIGKISEAWQEAADSGSNKPLIDVVTGYGGKGEDIHQLSILQPHSDEFVQAVMRLRGDKSRPTSKPKIIPVVETKPVVADVPVEPIEPKVIPKQAISDITPEEEYKGVQLNQRNENIQTPLGQEVASALSEKGKATAPTSAYKAAVEELNRSRGLNTKVSESIEGKGQIKGKDILVNPKLETLDTRPHEAAHDLVSTINEAAGKGSERARLYLDNLKKAQQEGLDSYNAERAKQKLPPIDHEEFTASEQGHEFLKQQLNLNRETKWRKWWNDTKALWNTAYGKNPTIEDLRRVLNFRYVNENVNTERAIPNVTKKEEKTQIPPTEEIKPFENAEEKDMAIKSIKDEAGAREVLSRLDKEKDILAKQGIENVSDEQSRHSIANKMMANKMDSQMIANKFRIKDYQTKYQPATEGLSRTELSPNDLAEVKKLGYTYDGPQDWGEPVGVMHAFTNRSENPNDPASRATFYAKPGEENKIVELAKAKNAEFNNPAPVESMEDFKNRVTSKMQGKEEGLPQTNLEQDIHLTDPSRQSFIRGMSASFDRVAELSQPIAQAARDYENRKSGYIGLGNATLTDLSKFKREDVNRIMAEHREAYRNNTEPNLSSENDKKISTILSNYYGKIADLRRDMNLEVGGRKGGKNQYYVPDMMNAHTADTLMNHPTSPEALAIKRQWEEHVLEQAPEMDAEDVRKNINEYVGALGGKSNNYKSLEFGAIRKAAGYGLPESMRDEDAISTLARYSRRAAADLAFFQEIQSKPDIAGPLHIKDSNGHIPNIYKDSPLFQDKRIKDMMKWVTNDFSQSSQAHPLLRSVTRLINNALLGPATGLRDLASVPMNAIPYIHQFSDLGAAIKGMVLSRENSRAALETGARQPQIDKIAFNDILESPNRYAVMIGKAADLMRKYQGREAIENFSRDVTFSIGKELARNNIVGARNGKEASKKWIEKFSDLVNGDPLTLQGPELETALNQIAKNFTDRNQGTYGGRGLPAGIMDSQFAPFLALQKWSVEKANVIYKDVYKPFITGENRLPMLTYTLGSLITGWAIQQLNQLLSGKKASDPTVTEALDKGDAASIAHELVTIMQLGSWSGILSDGLKTIADMGIRGKVPRNIVSFPTATAAAKTGESVADMMEAIRQGEDPWKVLKAFSLDLFINNVQAARMIANQTINDEATDRKDKFRDVRVYNELEGKPASDITKSNPYLGLDTKEFKQTKDINRAIELAPEIVKSAVEKSGGSGEKLKKSLSSAKVNSYQTMPSYKSSPKEFVKYYQYLVRTQGKEAADARMLDSMSQNSLNKLKARLIP